LPGTPLARRSQRNVAGILTGSRLIETSEIGRITGPGLSNEVREKLFQPFVTTKASGMGVGLSICRGIVEARGGRMWAEENSGGGTVFRFTLPSGSAI